MIGMGRFGAEGASYKGGGKGKGKGQSNFAASNGFVAQQGFAGCASKSRCHTSRLVVFFDPSSALRGQGAGENVGFPPFSMMDCFFMGWKFFSHSKEFPVSLMNLRFWFLFSQVHLNEKKATEAELFGKCESALSAIFFVKIYCSISFFPNLSPSVVSNVMLPPQENTKRL